MCEWGNSRSRGRERENWEDLGRSLRLFCASISAALLVTAQFWSLCCLFLGFRSFE